MIVNAISRFKRFGCNAEIIRPCRAGLPASPFEGVGVEAPKGFGVRVGTRRRCPGGYLPVGLAQRSPMYFCVKSLCPGYTFVQNGVCLILPAARSKAGGGAVAKPTSGHTLDKWAKPFGGF